MTGRNVAKMIGSEKSPTNETSIWSGLCDICHENGFCGDSANYGDCHFDDGFDDGYGCDGA